MDMMAIYGKLRGEKWAINIKCIRRIDKQKT
jgi:hypothetical protein